jgi:pyruvate,water dikinase
MIKDMENIAPGKYDALRVSFTTIQREIDALLARKKEITDQRLVVPLSGLTSDMIDIAGGKMANLGDVKNRLHLNVPPGFVITAAAHEHQRPAEGG